MKEPKHLLYEFSGFRLDPEKRILRHNGEAVVLTPKGFDTLVLLVRNGGRVLTKDELMKALWPESFVEEGNLTQHIFVLRKVLGDDQNGHSFIQTVPRHGYKFVASVKELRTDSSLPADYWSQHSPFRGLQVFEPDDAWLFFGRERETAELLAHLARSPVLVVIGDSGCGKSSLVRAGLIRALRAGAGADRFDLGDALGSSWRVAVVRPSGSPFDYLAEVLPSQLAPELSVGEQTGFIADCRSKLRAGGEALRDAISALVHATAEEPDRTRVLLVVDQFEEIFTSTIDREECRRYIDALLAASRWNASVPVHLVLMLRADFYRHCLEHPGLSRCLENNLYNVPRMAGEQLRQIIEKRLELAAAKAESGLIDSLLGEVGAEPGDLALLEHALSQLWEVCGGPGCTLTNGAYSTIGRLRGALSAHADRVYDGLSGETQKQLAQKIFLELVHIGEGAPDTRRRVRKEELLALGATEEVESLLTRLTSDRLISTSREGQSFVEVSHEALIREWSTLRDWITQSREDLRMERRLRQTAQEWEDLNRDTEALLRGTRLVQAEAWLLRRPSISMPELLREFIQSSVAAGEEAKAEELRKQRAAAVGLRWISLGLAGLLFIVAASVQFLPRLVALVTAEGAIEALFTKLSFTIGIVLELLILRLLIKHRLQRRLFWFLIYVLYSASRRIASDCFRAPSFVFKSLLVHRNGRLGSIDIGLS